MRYESMMSLNCFPFRCRRKLAKHFSPTFEIIQSNVNELFTITKAITLLQFITETLARVARRENSSEKSDKNNMWTMLCLCYIFTSRRLYIFIIYSVWDVSAVKNRTVSPSRLYKSPVCLFAQGFETTAVFAQGGAGGKVGPMTTENVSLLS